MTPEESARLRELCTQAQKELDPVKLVELIQEINRVFDQSEQREKEPLNPEDLNPESS